MSEGAALPPMPAMAVTRETVIPLAALAMPDEGEEMQEPAEGDLVMYQVEGRVVRLDGGNAVVAIENVNGQPIEAKEAGAGLESMESLTQSAQEMGGLP